MGSTVLRLRITGAPGAYKVSADVGGNEASDDLGQFPEKLRENLQPLQEAILRTSESLRTREPIRQRIINAKPGAAPAVPVRGFNFAEGADSKSIQEIGSRLFDCVFQPAVFRRYQEALEAALDRSELHVKLCVEPPDIFPGKRCSTSAGFSIFRARYARLSPAPPACRNLTSTSMTSFRCASSA